MYLSDLSHPNASLEDKLNALFRLNRGRKLEQGFRQPYLSLLERFGNPHKNLPPAIHVAGTNGKGSTIAMMRAIYEAAGYSVHAYTSPHLVRFNERIVLNGLPIEDGLLESLIDEARALHGGGEEISFFEITTALAFAAFARAPADLCLIEVGLGGRLDCTNVIEHPALSVITTIGLDHTEFLGETFGEIAAEKAGIMKRGAVCVIGPQSARALEGGVMDVFENTAKSKECIISKYGTDWIVNAEGGGVGFEFGPVHMHLPAPALPGPHQIDNAGVALAAIACLQDRFPVSREEMKSGLGRVEWPARLQRLEPAVFDLPPVYELWLDGGHNPEAGAALAAMAAQWFTNDSKPLHVIFGMMAHKDFQRFIEPLGPYIETLHAVDIPGEPKALGAMEAAQALAPFGKAVHAHPDIGPALAHITATGKPGRILICGSLYLAGHVLKRIGDRGHNAGSEHEPRIS